MKFHAEVEVDEHNKITKEPEIKNMPYGNIPIIDGKICGDIPDDNKQLTDDSLESIVDSDKVNAGAAEYDRKWAFNFKNEDEKENSHTDDGTDDGTDEKVQRDIQRDIVDDSFVKLMMRKMFPLLMRLDHPNLIIKIMLKECFGKFVTWMVMY